MLAMLTKALRPMRALLIELHKLGDGSARVSSPLCWLRTWRRADHSRPSA